MKRKNNLYDKICSLENLRLADAIARQGKGKQRGIKKFDKNAEQNLLHLHHSLINKTYKPGKYAVRKIYDPKERDIHVSPYIDRIVHHAIMNILEPLFVSVFTADTYSCIKRRGVHRALRAVKRALKDVLGTQYCLKLDVRKFYPSVDNDILKAQLRRKIKDNNLLWLLDTVIDSASGLPIGNYLSGYLSNFFLTGFDHWLKEVKHVKYYFRYADDMVFFSDNKAALHQLLADIRQYLSEELNLTVKGNYQVFPLRSRRLDFLGYNMNHSGIWLRKKIKKRFARAMKRGCSQATKASYLSWTKHGNCRNLERTLLVD